MKDSKFVKFSQSVILKSVLLLIGSMVVIIIGGTYYFIDRQMQTALNTTAESNKVQLTLMATRVHNEMQQFGNQLALLAKASEIKGMDPTIADRKSVV